MAAVISGATVRELRTMAGISVRSLAERCGVHHSTIVRIEQGRPRKFTRVTDLDRKLADALGVPADAITLPAQAQS